MKIFLLLTLFFSFISCNSSLVDEVEVMPKETDEFFIKIDTIRVETPGTTQEFPYLFPVFNYWSPAFAGLDHRNNIINVYDLDAFEIRDSIQLHEAGPHVIQGNMVGSVWYHNPDSIFVLQNLPNRLMIVNGSGEITWQKDLKEVFNNKNEINGLIAFGLFQKVGLYFQDDKVFFALRQNQAKQDFLAPMIGYYDFEKDDIFTLDVHYPAFYRENEEVGAYSFPGITWLEESFMVVLPHSPEIFIYDYQGQLKKHVQRPSGFAIGKAPNPGESSREQLENNPVYRVVRPVQGGIYYVLHKQGNLPSDPESEIFCSTIVYNHDFTKYFTIEKNERPISFGGDYFYYPIPQEETGYQLMERYRVEM